MQKLSAVKNAITGAVCGATNGFFGAGGGVLVVPMLENEGFETKKAHATSLAIMLPISIVSALIYSKSGSLDIMQAVKYIPCGLIGVWLGSRLLKKLSSESLKRLFGAVMIYFGVRSLLQ